MQNNIENLKKIDNSFVQNLISSYLEENPRKFVLKHWLFSRNLSLQDIDKINKMMLDVRLNNRQFVSEVFYPNSISIAESIIFWSFLKKNPKNKKMSYLDSIIIDYLGDCDESLSSKDDHELCLMLLKIFEKSKTWYRKSRKNDFFIFTDILHRLKNKQFLLNKDAKYIKNHFRSQVKILEKFSSLQQGDICFFKKNPCIVTEPIQLNDGCITLKVLLDNEIQDLTSFEINLVTKRLSTKNE